MTEIAAVVKQCVDCGIVKNLSEFSKDGNGHTNYCKPCGRVRNKRNRDKRIAKIGIDAERERSRISVAKWRAKPEARVRHRAEKRTYRIALRRLRDNHRKEYDHLVREERHTAGLPI